MFSRMFVSVCAGAILSTAAIAQDLPKTQFKVIGLNGPTPVSIHDEVPFWRKTITGGVEGRHHRRHHAARPDGHRRQDHAPAAEARRHGLRRHGHLQDGRRRPALRGLRPRRPDARSRQGARRLRRLSRRDRPADAEELERQAPGVRRQHAAGVLVQGRIERARRLQGQEGPRVQQHDARLPRRRRRDRGQHGVRRSGAGAQRRRGGLRRHRQPVGQHRRLDRGDEVDLSDVARLEHQRAGRQPRPPGSGSIRRRRPSCSSSSRPTKTRCGRRSRRPPARPTTATPASSPAPWASSPRRPSWR